MRLHRTRKITELGNAPVDRALKRPVIHFKGIARVQRHHRSSRIVMPLV